jgi:hypothetical protein
VFVTPRSLFDFRPLEGSKVQLQWALGYKDGDILIEVPDGFICDLASYPRLGRALFDRLGKSMRPSVVHDYLYREGPDGFARADADRIFREGLKLEGASWAECWASWLGVRIGGWLWWVKPD